jgi:hypothetical protein
MTLDNLITIGFCLAMLANAIAFVRHWRMMRMMHMMLSGLARTQAEFNEVYEAQIRRRGDDDLKGRGADPGGAGTRRPV